MAPIKVGDTIFVRDINHRVYAEAPAGRLWSNGGPLEVGYWSECEVTKVGRTNVYTKYATFDKTTLRPKVRDNECCSITEAVRTRAEMEDRIWVIDNGYHLAEEVRSCRDAAVLRQVAALVDYKERP